MLKKVLFSAAPVSLERGVAIVRIIVGALLVYHGQEVFNTPLMAEYMTWDAFAGPNARLLVYVGKSTELIAGLLLLFGLFTRLGALMTIVALSYITFFVGNGRFWYEDQHPFMFVLFGLLFLFTGPGAWSVDGLIFKGRKNGRPL
ncbi:MAG: DoxX family protein [Sinomicrobium sp.]|nr:DoxX family protein [Sinomicrobium sp.]